MRLGPNRRIAAGVAGALALITVPLGGLAASPASGALSGAPSGALSGALAPTATAQSKPRLSRLATIQLGPIDAKHGYRMSILATCTPTGDFAQVTFTKAGHHYRLTHYYTATGPHGTRCNVSTRLRTGRLTLRWGRAVRARLRVTRAGPLRGTGATACSSASRHREITATGTLRLSVHAEHFGRLVFHRLAGQASRFSFWVATTSAQCSQSSLGGSAALDGQWLRHRSARLLSGYVSPDGKRSITVNAPDDVGQRVSGQLADEFTGGRRLFSFRANLRSARLGRFRPFLTGAARYTATEACAHGMTSGVLRGRLVLHDPVLGRISLFGSRAAFVTLMRLSASC